MNSSPLLWVRALWAKPTTLLQLTKTTATLSLLASDQKSYATFQPTPYLLGDKATLATPQQLTQFLEHNLNDQTPFSLLVSIDGIETKADLIAAQAALVLIKIKTPAYLITQDYRTTTPPESHVCLLTGRHPHTKRSTMSLLAASLILSVAGGFFFAHQPLHPGTAKPFTHQKSIKKERIKEPLYKTMAAFCYLNRRDRQLSALSVTPKGSRCKLTCTSPQQADRAQQLLKKMSSNDWAIKTIRYQFGYPPLYYYALSCTDMI